MRLVPIRILSKITAAGLLALACGCASTPKGSTSYYFPKAETQFVITQTLACNADGSKLHQAITVTPQTAYSSDLDVPPFVLAPHDLSGAFADTDLSLAFTDDGRLSGINFTSTGQGGTLVKDLISIVKAVGVAAAAAPGGLPDPAGACKTIKDYSAKSNKPPPAGSKPPDPKADADTPVPTLTLNYVGVIHYGEISKATPDAATLGIRSESDIPSNLGPSVTIYPDAGSVGVYKELLEIDSKAGIFPNN